MFACEFDLVGERQVVTNEDAGPGDNAGGERLVVAVTQPEYPAVVVAGFLCVGFHETEVALSLMGQRMSLRADAQVGGDQRALDGGDEFRMLDGTPTVGGTRCFDIVDLSKATF